MSGPYAGIPDVRWPGPSSTTLAATRLSDIGSLAGVPYNSPMPLSDILLDRVGNLPECPGVYLWKDARGEVLYVGKANRLRSRVRSYLAGHHDDVKTVALMRQ